MRPADDLEKGGFWEVGLGIEFLFVIGSAGREIGANRDGSPWPSASNFRFELFGGGPMFDGRLFKDALDNSASVVGGLSLLGLVCAEPYLN